jgi:hypothetical protein
MVFPGLIFPGIPASCRTLHLSTLSSMSENEPVGRVVRRADGSHSSARARTKQIRRRFQPTPSPENTTENSSDEDDLKPPPAAKSLGSSQARTKQLRRRELTPPAENITEISSDEDELQPPPESASKRSRDPPSDESNYGAQSSKDQEINNSGKVRG